MNYKTYASTFLSIQRSNQFMKMVCLCLLATNILVVFGWLKKDTSIILVPPGLSEKSEIAKNKASEGYKKSWAMYVATLIGNVTPENADFVLDSFGGMVTGEIRQSVIEQITQELDTLKLEKVSSTFEIVYVTYEPETDKVYISGRNRMTGAGGKSVPTEQTFEFKIDVKQYSPIITQMASYAGQPKLTNVLQKEEVKRKAAEDSQKSIKK
jgi:conjugal transfer pilus assembly protein TraE